MYNPYVWIYDVINDRMIIANENFMLFQLTFIYHLVCVYINPFIGYLF